LSDDFAIPLRNRERLHIDVVPLIDVVFVLLIFTIMMVTFTDETGLDVRKPSAQSATYQGAKTLLIGISPEGTIHIHGKQVSLERLAQVVSVESKRQSDPTVVIVADKMAQVGRAVEVMDACLQAGVKKVSIAADRR
jgi:biopolymer transport protein ExbD